MNRQETWNKVFTLFQTITPGEVLPAEKCFQLFELLNALMQDEREREQRALRVQ